MDNIITGDIFTVVSTLRAELATAQAENERLKAQLSETWQPVAAEPVVLDWSQYGQCDFFAIDESGEGYAFSDRPTQSQGIWTIPRGLMPYVGEFNLNGIDFRTTLTERPNQPQGVTRV